MIKHEHFLLNLLCIFYLTFSIQTHQSFLTLQAWDCGSSAIMLFYSSQIHPLHTSQYYLHGTDFLLIFLDFVSLSVLCMHDNMSELMMDMELWDTQYFPEDHFNGKNEWVYDLKWETLTLKCFWSSQVNSRRIWCGFDR